MARDKTTSIESEDSALETSARERLGVESWDRPLIFRETAEAATDVRLPYWSLLVLSAAIATLGLALDNAAVVIGAMLIAPLLAPTMGLALALAMGDVRLAGQTGVAVAVSTAVVVVTAMALTLVLPYHSFTPEITARTRPTTLDLAIAVFSGLAGAVVSVTRRKGLSAAIPGVAVAVALLPPLAVAGFSAGAGFRWTFVKGSMLLYGANLAGIVFSGTLIFLLIGMHRPEVVEEARKWHSNAVPTRMASWSARMRWIPTLGPARSPATRIGLVLVIIAALGMPLTITLTEIVRERRVQRAVASASEIFEVDGRSSILNLDVVVGEAASQARIRVATTEWYGDESRENFQRAASSRAGEPIQLTLEQIPTSVGDLDQLYSILPERRREDDPSPPDLYSIVAPARERVDNALAGLSLPDSIRIVGAEMLLGNDARRRLTVGYAAARPMSPDVNQILARQIRMALSAPNLEVEWDPVLTDTLSLTGTRADSSRVTELASLMTRYENLRLAVVSDTNSTTASADSTVRQLTQLGVDRARVERNHMEGSALRVHLHASHE